MTPSEAVGYLCGISSIVCFLVGSAMLLGTPGLLIAVAFVLTRLADAMSGE